MAEKEYIERDAAINVVVNNPYRIASKTGKTIQEIKEIPTADVVPKSEVEKIFEEIETIIDNNTYKSYLPNSSLWSKEYKIKQIIAEIVELKKKYIGEKE